MQRIALVRSGFFALLTIFGLTALTGCPGGPPVVDGDNIENPDGGDGGGGGGGSTPDGSGGAVGGGGSGGGSNTDGDDGDGGDGSGDGSGSGSGDGGSGAGSGGGGSSGGNDSGGGNAPDPNSIDDFTAEFSGKRQKLSQYRDALTREEAWHLLRRTSFGATEAQVKAAMDAGLSATIDDLLVRKPMPAAVNSLANSYDYNTSRRWMVYLIESPNPLYERMAMFWHDRFATSRRVAAQWNQRYLPNLHMDMLRKHALGDYRQMLLELTLDPLMLLWLNGAESPKENPNENYTREFWELFTLGRDVLYTEADIQQGSLAFTGITLLYQPNQNPRPIFDLLHHDNSQKRVFPSRAEAKNHDYLSITDLTLAQPEAARYVARNLFVFFVHDNPSDAVVEELAELFVKRNFNIKPVVAKILKSQALFSSAARYNQITSPVEHFVSFARTTDMHIHSEASQTWKLTQLIERLRDAGQELLDPPGVEGWSEGVPWLADQWIMSRANAFGRAMEYGPNRTDLIPYHLLPPVSTWGERESRKAIVNTLAKVFHLSLTDEEVEIYVEVLDQNGIRAFHLLTEDQRPPHVFEVMRLMAMDERFITR